MLHTESDIITALQASDEACIKMMFDNYYQALCVYAVKYSYTIENAEDVVQDVFVSFWENRKGKPFEGSIRAYLFGAVAKASLKQLKRSGKVVFDDIEAHVNRFLEEINSYEENEEELLALKKKIEQEVEKLPEKSKEVLKAIILDNLSYKKVAENMSVSVNTVKTHYSRALRQLRINLDDLVVFLLFL